MKGKDGIQRLVLGSERPAYPTACWPELLTLSLPTSPLSWDYISNTLLPAPPFPSTVSGLQPQ